MFNKTILATAMAVAAMGSVSAMAADVGLITFDGAVTDTTCVITTNNGIDANNITISLPVVKKADLEKTTVDTGIGSKEFALHMSQCPETLNKASANFTSQQFADLSNGTLKSDATVAGHAANVNLALFNNTATKTDRIKVGNPNNNTQVTDLTGGEGQLSYRVAYVPSAAWVKGTNDITAGKVSSNVTFTMSYE
ncbi:fimbrial protein [Enterobacter quasiroggenkampii]|uniref:fimbrial protein n=1 Tax=Enterobacter quasiroggenkampii TaxID=2497436 RepID=UPI0021D36D29|nr:fimbrial protein [Enterobacter quasiroggenkampii]MCU6276762.1 fimbrial protein [Enterobacter quasiroggenkampii]MCU6307294.1 fimbrial protein [Enterobacter quasiroggenkampii]MCU6330421.1 fimbrial protein [Enterobacter quasiroggenkampii]MCU6336475.1 fimbrial protein [Enterobacter quasiroggenkampii]MCU6385297.1 fimbrial protein [Enterobacter quasiroggenkampii]